MLRYVVLLAAASAIASSQTPTIDQSLAMKTASAPRISPDGRFVAYQVQKANWEENSFETDIWVSMLATGERYQLTTSRKSSTDPEWSPDGKMLAFLSDREGKRQVYLISPMGGEATQITNVESGVTAMKWSPDGAMIAYVSTGTEPKALKERKEKYGEYAQVRGDYRMAHLWLIRLPLKEGEKPAAEQITKGDRFTVGEFAWAPDSTRIAFTAARDPDMASRGTTDLYVLRLNDGYVKKLVDLKGPEQNPVWSPDSKEIAFETAGGAEMFFYVNSRIGIVVAGGGPPRILPLKLDESPHLVEWNSSGLHFSAFDKTYSHLFRLNPASNVIERVTAGNRFFSGFSFTRDGRTMAYTAAGDNEMSEVYVSPAAQGAASPRVLTAMNDQLRPYRLARRELIEWKSTDGTPIQGVLIKPPDFEPGKKYPLLVVIHGGPTGTDRAIITPDRYYPIERFATKGALILRPNYRGSAGYGERFRSLNVRNLGVGDAWDVLSGVDALIAKGLVDKDRVGVMGWSQGGYISAFLGTSTSRFKAVSVGAGISDWTTYYVNTDITPFTRQYLGATPWDDPDIYRRTSPIGYVKTARTPTLIQHGELDRRVPIPNAYELRQALEDRGIPVKMYVFKGFGHGIDKPKQQRAIMEQNYDWFSEWVWGEKMTQ
jgi:dipeptidyl aminopeptidase/acylaminoacyl peptidase